MPSDFPVADKNRAISAASDQLLRAMAPASWHFCSLPENDFGLDLLVQVDAGSGIEHAFGVQLKGTGSPSYVKDGAALSYGLKRRTLNYYASLPLDVMLVVAVVALDETGKVVLADSKVLWQWMSVEIEAKRGSAAAIDLSTSETTVVHLPTHQALHPRLDVLPYLHQQRELAHAQDAMQKLLVRNGALGLDSGAAAFLRMAETVATRETEFMALLQGEDSDTPSLPQVQEVKAFLRVGNTDQADATLREIDATGLAQTPAVMASVCGLRARVAMQRWDRQEALTLFEQAHGIDPSDDRLVAVSELRFLMAIDVDDAEAIREVCDALKPLSSSDALTLRARAHVSLRQFDQARACLDELQGTERVMAELIVLSGEGRWGEVRSMVRESIASHALPTYQVAAMQLLAARAAWFEATQAARQDPEHDETPLSGAVGTDVALAHEAWRWSTDCIESLKMLGWPNNVELIAPVVCACAGAIGRQREALALLKPAAEVRPKYPELQHNMELLAIGCDDIGMAFTSNERQGDEHAVLVRRVLLLHALRRFADCAELAFNEVTADDRAIRHAPMALALGYAAARRVGKLAVAEELLARIASVAAWDEYVHFARFADLGALPVSDPRPLKVLREGLTACPQSGLIAANLFANLDVSKEDQAAEAVVVARSMPSTALMSRRDSLHLLAAFLTLKQWEQAVGCSSAALLRFGPSDDLLAMAAVSHEMAGQTAEALTLLEQAIASGTNRISVVYNYMGLVLRLGRTAAARTAIDRLLELTTERTPRLELLRMSAVVDLKEGRVSEADATIAYYGSLVDRDVEREEGTFLNLAMVSSLFGVQLDGDRRREFEQRSAAFSERWPRSLSFRSVEFPQEALSHPDELARILDPDGGDPKVRREDLQRKERAVQEGRLPMPFMLRPRHVLSYVSNVFELWDVSKRAPRDKPQLHLVAARADGEPASPDLRRDVPLLDLSTLLVLDALDVFDRIFLSFRRVAIPRLTVAFISQHANDLLGFGPGPVVAKSILARINTWLSSIDQPIFDAVARAPVVSAHDVVLDYVHLARSCTWLAYCDDAFVRSLLSQDGRVTTTCVTTEVLDVMEADGHVSAADVAGFLSQLADWNVGIRVAHRHTIAALSGALPDSHLSVPQRMDRFRLHRPFATLSQAIWSPAKDGTSLTLEMGQLLVVMLHPGSDDDSIAAVLGCWYARLRLNPSAPDDALKVACLVAIFALANLPHAISGRVIAILRAAVAAVHGDAMSMAVEQKLLEELGAIAADVGHQRKNPSFLLSRLSRAMPEGTQDGDAWTRGYTGRVLELHKPQP